MVGVGPLGPRLGRRVAIKLGEPVRFPSMLSVPLTWEPVGLEGLLPRLDATIEVGSLGQDQKPHSPLRPIAVPKPTIWYANRSTTQCRQDEH